MNFRRSDDQGEVFGCAVSEGDRFGKLTEYRFCETPFYNVVAPDITHLIADT